MVRSLSLAAGLGVCAASASAAFVGGTAFSDSTWNAAASAALGQQAHVFRMYAAFDSAGDRLLSVYDANFDAIQGTLFQSAFGGDTAGNINPAFFPVFPEVQWDSYVSVGALNQPSTTATDPNFMWTTTGVTNNTGWFNNNPPGGEGTAQSPAVGDSSGLLPGGMFYTFIGQFTLVGVETPEDLWIDMPEVGQGVFLSDGFIGSLSLSYDTGPGTGAILVDGVEIIPAPGAAALLGLAGLTAARRRR